MCTAITYKTDNNYFGRTLDLEHLYNETVTIAPRNFKFKFRTKSAIANHYAIIGTATVEDGYPLYYDAVNECGLAMAGLNFPENAHYFSITPEKDNIAPFEFIPWVLCQCKNLEETQALLSKLNLSNISFSTNLPLSPLHFIIADKSGSITVESVAKGLKIYENPVGVLTNSPPFDYHLTRFCDFANLTNTPPQNRFKELGLSPYSKGLGAMGLPGDFSSSSRFIRAAFAKLNSVSQNDEESSINQFFHILDCVSVPRGVVFTPDVGYNITQYTSCINIDKGIYYYKLYENSCISSVDMYNCDLDSNQLYKIPLAKTVIINKQN